MLDSAGTATKTTEEARKESWFLFVNKINSLRANMHRAFQNAEIAVIKTAEKKWCRDNPDYSREFPEPITEDTHRAELEITFNALVSEVNAAITDSHTFD